jgi:putative membrane protein
MDHAARNLARGLVVFCAGVSTPVWAVSIPDTAGSRRLAEPEAPPVSLYAMESVATGSASLVPLMASEAQAGGTTGEPVDDIAFVKQATESGRKEVAAARDALPQLKQPELKRIAEMLVADHSGANSRLSKIAEAKGWPVPAPQAAPPPPSGTASSDFDAKWIAEMIAGHERSIALYRAQARAGEDEELREYARATLPTIERHLAELRKLQK